MVNTRTLGMIGAVLGALAVVVSPAAAKQGDCKVHNRTTPSLSYHSNKDASPLETAIAEAQPGDTLEISGVCRGNFVASKELMLTGRRAGHHEDVLDGGGSGTVLRNSSAAGAVDLTISDLTITGGDIGVEANDAAVSLLRTSVVRNTIGVVSGFAPSITIADSIVSDNDGLGVAGGVFGSITIENSTVSRNEGGGVYSGRAALTVSGSLVSDNRGLGVGGNRGIQVSHSVIEGNTTEGFGGGIAAFDLSSLELTDSIVRGNAASRGGGIFLDRSMSPNTITRSLVTGNSATEEGGGIYGPGQSLLSITDSTVSNNSANSGGGLFLFARSGSSTEITSSSVTGNRAVNGGGIWNEQPLTLSDSAVTGNTALTAGGGIFNTGTVTLVGTATVCGNVPNDWPGCST